MAIRANFRQWWKGELIQKDQVFPNPSEKEKQALLESRQGYESVQDDAIETPTMANLREEIIDFLEANDIAYTADMNKKELLDLIDDDNDSD